MTADSDNNVFGRTVNPHNVNLTAGGSTGGEGALIALRGSVLGVGTDIGMHCAHTPFHKTDDRQLAACAFRHYAMASIHCDRLSMSSHTQASEGSRSLVWKV